MRKCESISVFNVCILLLVLTCFFLLAWILINQIKDHYSQFEPKLQEIKKRVQLVIPDVINSISLYEGNDSYTINKKKTYICLTDNNGNYYDDNTLVHVLLHEMAHVMCDEIGHTNKFHSIFTDLLKKAEKKGIYDPHKAIPPDYAKGKHACRK